MRLLAVFAVGLVLGALLGATAMWVAMRMGGLEG